MADIQSAVGGGGDDRRGGAGGGDDRGGAGEGGGGDGGREGPGMIALAKSVIFKEYQETLFEVDNVI